MKTSLRNICKILAGGVISMMISGTVMIGSVQAGEGYGGGYGGVPGCATLVLATCFGAVWRWYSTSSNYVWIDGTVNDYTCDYDYLAYPGAITGCGDYGGYWRYAWVAQRHSAPNGCGYSYDQYDQRGLSAIGAGDYPSAYFGGPMKYAYGYRWNDGGWNEVKEIYLALQAQDPYTYSAGWSYGSSLSWFCGPSSVEEVQPQVKEYTLTARAVDESGNSLRNIIRDVTSTVEEGNYTYVDRRTQTNYIFKGFKYRANDSYFASTDTRWGQYMYSDTTVYAVYHEYKEYTLTGIAYDTDGNSLRNLMANVTNTVEEGHYASITRRTAAAYTFMGWKSSLSSSSYISTNSTYAVTALWSNQTVYAIYQHQEFSGRARVTAGSSISGNGTGFVQSNATQSIEMDCPNSGCTAVFDTALKLEKGEGNVNYVVYRQLNNGSSYTQTTSPAAPFEPSTSGTTISVYLRSAYRNPYMETLYPGQTLCYSIVFSPKGNGNATAKACVYAKPSSFEGQINVSTPSGNASVGYTGTTTTVTKDITNCPNSGCTVSFTHNLKRTAGTGSTDYVMVRTSNYQTLVQDKSLGSGEEFFTRNPHQILSDANLTLRPGVVVCETLQFKPSNNVVTSPGYVTLKLCASALGKAQPNDPTNDPQTMEDDQLSDAFLDMRVKNPDGPTKYQKYQKAVYAKPGNTVSFRASYNPILQYSAFIVPQRMKIDSGSIKPTGSINTYYYLHQLFNQNRGQNNSWNNAIMVHSNGTFNYSTPHSYTIGDPSKQKEVNTHRVTISEVGNDLAESATTNITKYNRTATSPSQVTFSSSTNQENLATVDTTSKTSMAHVYVPYNYDTELEVKTDNDKPIYAGEEKEIEYRIDVIPRKNPETTDGSDAQKYATIVPDFLGRIIVYTPLNGVKNPTNSWGNGKTQDVCAYFGLTKDEKNCRYGDEKSGTLNSNGNLNGLANNIYKQLLQVPDQKAGTYICVAVATYPANSGAYTNWSESEGSKTWRISESKCFLIAKRPSFQVWGGSLYSGGTITTSAAVKNNLRNLPSFSGVYVFSSWVEQTVTANGAVKLLASGAAAGLANNIAGGGSAEPNKLGYCVYRVPLSIANYSSSIASPMCPGPDITGLSGISAVLTNQKSLVGRLPNEDSLTNEYADGSVITINNSVGKNIVRYNVNGNATINANTVAVGRTHIITVTGDLTINGNIEYQNNARYTQLDQIPKVIIYAENIKIGCTVRRIDAIIIAEKDLNTCVSDDINSRQNSYRLQFNGAIITDTLEFNRTYGAATGVNSKVPAEIVNYDVSTILWGRAKADPGNEHKNLTAVYTHEIAPRY